MAYTRLSMKKIALGGKHGVGKYAIVDDDDYDRVAETKWSLSVWPDGRYYVCGWRDKKHAKLHRFVTNAPKGQYLDHINRDTLDNRKKNLRFCTNQENQYNSRNTLGRSLPKGVYKTHHKTKPYRAHIMFDGKTIHLGYYKYPGEASIAYQNKLKEIAGEFCPASRC